MNIARSILLSCAIVVTPCTSIAIHDRDAISASACLKFNAAANTSMQYEAVEADLMRMCGGPRMWPFDELAESVGLAEPADPYAVYAETNPGIKTALTDIKKAIANVKTCCEGPDAGAACNADLGLYLGSMHLFVYEVGKEMIGAAAATGVMDGVCKLFQMSSNFGPVKKMMDDVKALNVELQQFAGTCIMIPPAAFTAVNALTDGTGSMSEKIAVATKGIEDLGTMIKDTICGVLSKFACQKLIEGAMGTAPAAPARRAHRWR